MFTGRVVSVVLSWAVALAASGCTIVQFTPGKPALVPRPGIPMAWGANNFAQLGDGAPASAAIALPDRPTPGPVIGLTHVVAIAGGGNHSLVLRSDGTVWAWGLNGHGQLGVGTLGGLAGTSTPVQVIDPGDPTGFITDVVAVAAGFSHSLALRKDGSVWAWGSNNQGQLGNGTTILRHTSKKISGLTNVRAIAAGGMHSLAVTSDPGTVWAWGLNNQGQLGDGTTVSKTIPVKVIETPGDSTGLLTGVIGIAAGGGDFVDAHSLALKSDGTVWAWGSNNQGQLGDGTTTPRITPGQVIDPGDPTGLLTGVIGIAGGGSTVGSIGYAHSLALKSDGTVWAWGSNNQGQLGNGTLGGLAGTSTPGQVIDPIDPTGFITDVRAVAAGLAHSLAIKSNGSVWAWGSNDQGQLGDGITTTGHRSTPGQVGGLTAVVAIAAGGMHSLAITLVRP